MGRKEGSPLPAVPLVLPNGQDLPAQSAPSSSSPCLRGRLGHARHVQRKGLTSPLVFPAGRLSCELIRALRLETRPAQHVAVMGICGPAGGRASQGSAHVVHALPQPSSVLPPLQESVRAVGRGLAETAQLWAHHRPQKQDTGEGRPGLLLGPRAVRTGAHWPHAGSDRAEAAVGERTRVSLAEVVASSSLLRA